MSSVTLPDGVYVLGGFDGQKYLDSCERLAYQFFNGVKSKQSPKEGFKYIQPMSQ